jgi:uncharacterized membrane protein YhaH (DUF805 family)
MRSRCRTLTFDAALGRLLRYLFVPRGRTGRVSFLLFLLLWTPVAWTVGNYYYERSAGLYGLEAIFSLFISAALALAAVTVYIRRLHDLGFSAWWMILYAALMVMHVYGGWIAAAVLACTAGEAGANRFGPVPVFPALQLFRLRLAGAEKSFVAGKTGADSLNAERTRIIARTSL